MTQEQIKKYNSEKNVTVRWKALLLPIRELVGWNIHQAAMQSDEVFLVFRTIAKMQKE